MRLNTYINSGNNLLKSIQADKQKHVPSYQ